MKLQLVSDLHLEFSTIRIENAGADVLVLAGDILVAQDLYDYPPGSYHVNPYPGKRAAAAKMYREFLAQVSGEFDHVVYVAGNHEFYHGKWAKTIDILTEETSRYPNIHYLERSRVEIDDVVFIGGTLWTDMAGGDPLVLYAISGIMNDYEQITYDVGGKFGKLRPENTVHRHRETLKYLRGEASAIPDKKVVVVGHHAPSSLSIHDQYRDSYPTNYAYYTDLTDVMMDNPNIKLWCHGHMHNPFDYKIGETRVICNPRGYEGYEPHSGWDPGEIFEV